MCVKLQTLKDISNYLAKELKEVYHDQEISAFADILTYTITGFEKLHIPEGNNFPLSVENARKIVSVCNELKKGKPIQYIIGEILFYNCKIKVNNDTFIPRPETEELVDLIIKENSGFKGKIIDAGTGSGCISIALAKHLPDAVITGIDIAEGAIIIAKENAKLNNVKVRFIKTDLFNCNVKKTGKANIIVSNPPYVRESEKQFMNKNVLDFEPHSALFVSDDNPLVFYHTILKLADKLLSRGGRIYFEINEAMGIPLLRMIESYRYSGVMIIKDINGKDRIVKATKDV